MELAAPLAMVLAGVAGVAHGRARKAGQRALLPEQLLTMPKSLSALIDVAFVFGAGVLAVRYFVDPARPLPFGVDRSDLTPMSVTIGFSLMALANQLAAMRLRRQLEMHGPRGRSKP